MSGVQEPSLDRSVHEVLVVDDNPATRYTTARVLRAAGFRTKEAGTGSEALHLVRTGVSAVILDVHLPDIDGFEVCGRIRTRAETALLPVIHLSASHVLDDDKVRGLDAGADAYMTHPAEPALLVATLQALIRARTAEEGMRRSDAGFRAIYEQAPSGISMLDAEGRFTEVNPAMLALLHRDAAAVLGKKLCDFAPHEWHAEIGQSLERSRLAVWRGEFPLLDDQGRPVYMEWSLSSSVRSGFVLAIATDISERIALSRQRDELLEREQAARAAAEAVSRSKDEFIAVLSHELRTPLNAIVGWTHVLQRFPDKEMLDRGLKAVQRNAALQTRLISDILDVSRIRLGKLPLEVESLDALEVVTASVAALSVALEEKSLTIALDAQDSLQPIVADPGRLQQIVWNLLTNAIKFSAPGGQVRVALSQDERETTLSVEDDGQGIDPEFIPFIFDRFTQGDPSSNRRHGGLGLGLSIVKQLSTLHGGSVRAWSAGRGLGARFVVLLPRTVVSADSRSEGVSQFGALADLAPRGRLAGLKILAVEDDADAREVLAALLRSEDAIFVAAGSYEQALQQLEQERDIDIIVSDIGMPGKDGYALLREIRRREEGSGERIPAVALTAFARAKDRDAAFTAGFDAHCAKPVEPEELIATLLAHRRPMP